MWREVGVWKLRRAAAGDILILVLLIMRIGGNALVLWTPSLTREEGETDGGYLIRRAPPALALHALFRALFPA